MLPRKRVLALAQNELDLIHQMLAIFAVNSQVALLENHPFLQRFEQVT
jgi:RHH-type proline utilization regulon transcriptional repressor/proline dehydrogenase/delta 1-pyrroline-5-carboxylate dehydrogenase